jgi:hypothetical protein
MTATLPGNVILEEGSMGNRFGYRVMVGLVIVATLATVGFYSYNLGVGEGIARSGQAVAAPAGTGVPVVFYPRPWGFGFGFFPFFPLMILFWVFVLRGLFWRGRWAGGGRGCRYDDDRVRQL